MPSSKKKRNNIELPGSHKSAVIGAKAVGRVNAEEKAYVTALCC